MSHSSREIRSTIVSAPSGGKLELSIATVDVADPTADEVLVRIQAAPINPSDLGLLFGPADMHSAKVSGTAENPVLTADVPAGLMGGIAARLDQSLPVGNEGSGVVIAAGEAPECQALLGKTVGIVGGATYSQLRLAKAGMCLAFPEGTTPAQCASWFVNPLTALGMVETMRAEGHTALVHTAAASNLGQMLNKICIQDGVELVNIVRKPEQAATLRSLGAKHVVDSSQDSYKQDLIAALATTGATLAFDATGGGRLASDILGCMEIAQNQNAQEYSRYGSSTHKQVYIYGGLDRGLTELNRNFGMAWGVSGWLLTPFLQKVGFEGLNRLRQRVAAEITTTFASTYTKEVSLEEALSLEAIGTYGRQATGEKYLIDPSRSA
jgi:NADPH2:quinone reductase